MNKLINVYLNELLQSDVIFLFINQFITIFINLFNGFMNIINTQMNVTIYTYKNE